MGWSGEAVIRNGSQGQAKFMSDREVSIQAASSQDISELVRLFNAYRKFYGEAPDEAHVREYIADRVVVSSQLEGEPPAAKYFLAWTDSGGGGRRAVGFMHLIPSTNTLAMRPIWFLEDLYVETSVRRSGIAAALLRYAEEFARRNGAERITLATAHDNAAAQALYRKLGYIREEHFWYFHRLLD
jgi:ribosomal protein S18 acetylase RimI-like enzyme